MPELRRTFAVLPEGRLVLEVDAPGPVRVTGGPAGTAELLARHGRLDPGRWIEVEAGQRAIRVEVSGGEAELEVRVPAAWAVSIDAGSAPIRVSGVTGLIDVDTGSGEVHLEQVGPVKVDSGSGPVTVRGARGKVGVNAGSGRVHIAGVTGPVQVDIGSGPVALEGIAGDEAVVDCSSGGLTVQGFRGRRLHTDGGSGPLHLKGLDVAELEVETGSGAVTVQLDRLHRGGRYRVTTGSGGIEFAVPAGGPARVRFDARPDRVHATTGGAPLSEHWDRGFMVVNGGGPGDAEIHLESDSGQVRLHEAPVPAGSAAPIAPTPIAPAPTAGPAPPAAPAETAAAEPAPPGEPARAADEEVARVLKMVEAGRLTPEEAADLLAALDGEPEGNEVA